MTEDLERQRLELLNSRENSRFRAGIAGGCVVYAGVAAAAFNSLGLEHAATLAAVAAALGALACGVFAVKSRADLSDLRQVSREIDDLKHPTPTAEIIPFPTKPLDPSGPRSFRC